MPRLIITISGLTGSGKTTLGRKIGKMLGIRHIWKTHKAFSGKAKVVEFTRKASVGFERSFDRNIVGEAGKQDCVVTTWLGPWLIKEASVRVWLYADIGSRIRRKADELKVSAVMARKYVEEKDKLNKVRFKKIYGIDIDDHGGFDLLINTSRLSPGQCANMVIFLTQEKMKKKFA
ncbi:MAG: cytidylate kinase family protein [Candidatus Micrarchaeota archaeon]|nr:cytidylate kinase family protein [Candidatus Micrarchaeota archaeon]